jgi:outer membrane protein TolC
MYPNRLVKRTFLLNQMKTKKPIMVRLFFVSTLLVLFFATEVNAQNQPPRRETTRTSLDDTTGESAIEERLVQLALQGPEFQTTVHQGKVTELQLKAARNSWLNLLTISANYNELSFSQQSQTILFPRYFFGLNIPLGLIFSRTEVKSAKESVAISKLTQEDKRRTIRSNVLGKYKQYKTISKIISLENESLLDVEAAVMRSEESFRKGNITIEAYNTSQRTRNDALTRIVNLRLQQDILELDLERMIGVPLESVVRR